MEEIRESLGDRQNERKEDRIPHAVFLFSYNMNDNYNMQVFP